MLGRMVSKPQSFEAKIRADVGSRGFVPARGVYAFGWSHSFSVDRGFLGIIKLELELKLERAKA